MNELATIGINGLYLLALINPISKVSILLTFAPHHRDKQFLALTAKSTIVAGGILFGAMIVGDFLRADRHRPRFAGGFLPWSDWRRQRVTPDRTRTVFISCNRLHPSPIAFSDFFFKHAHASISCAGAASLPHASRFSPPLN